MTEPRTAVAPAGGVAVSLPWVLLDAFDGRAAGRVIVDGGLPRRRTRLARSRIAGSSTVAHRLPEVIRVAVRTGRQHTVPAYRPTGDLMRITAVPVLAGEAVVAVQVWAGAATAPVPAKPAVGTVVWPAGSRGVGVTSAALERMIDSDRVTDSTRTLPDLMGHFDHIEDRNGLLGLFDPAAGARHWTGTAVTRGLSTRARRTLFLAAHSDGRGPRRVVRAVAADISAAHPPAPAPVAIRLLRELPVRGGHGIAVVDLKSGLLHEWIHPGPAPLHRWLHEIPDLDPVQDAELSAIHARLLAGLDHARATVRLRFDTDSEPVTVHATWVVLTRDGAPQAMLDLHLPEHSRRTAARPEPGDSS